jgi:hypothetical protein
VATSLARHFEGFGYDQSVGFWDVVGQEHVRQAVREYDRLGQDEFLAQYGFGRVRAYLLIVGEKSYDSKAIVGVAYRFATGRPLGPGDFSGGLQGAAAVLRSLGFEVRNLRDRPPSPAS